MERRVRAALDQVGLLEYEKSSPLSLSIGEQQRVGIARAVASRPELVIADEPTGNLDAETGKLVFAILLEFVRDFGQTLILVTHDHEMANCADRVLQMTNGKLTVVESRVN